jgi:hypothetical protein
MHLSPTSGDNKNEFTNIYCKRLKSDFKIEFCNIRIKLKKLSSTSNAFKIYTLLIKLKLFPV